MQQRFLLQILLPAQHVSGITMSSRVLYCGCCVWYASGHITLGSTPDQLLEKPQHKIPHAATTVLELLMMSMVMPEAC